MRRWRGSSGDLLEEATRSGTSASAASLSARGAGNRRRRLSPGRRPNGPLDAAVAWTTRWVGRDQRGRGRRRRGRESVRRPPAGSPKPSFFWGTNCGNSILTYCFYLFFGGEGGIRTLDAFPHTHFPGVLLRPLGHLSGFALSGRAAIRSSLIPAHALAATVAPFRAWRGSQPDVAGGPDWTAIDPAIRAAQSSGSREARTGGRGLPSKALGSAYCLSRRPVCAWARSLDRWGLMSKPPRRRKWPEMVRRVGWQRCWMSM